MYSSNRLYNRWYNMWDVSRSTERPSTSVELKIPMKMKFLKSNGWEITKWEENGDNENFWGKILENGERYLMNNDLPSLFILTLSITMILQVAGGAKEKSQTKKRQRQSNEKKFKIKRSRKKKTFKKSKKTHISRCLPGCLLKVSDYMGLSEQSEKMTKILNRNFDFNQIVGSFTTKDSGFESRKIVVGKKFDPLLVDPGHIYLIQLCSVHVHNNTVFDNFHAVSLFDNKIFDFNFESPLPLTKDNLNRCCLGEDWVYHHCSRVNQICIQIGENKKHWFISHFIILFFPLLPHFMIQFERIWNSYHMVYCIYFK